MNITKAITLLWTGCSAFSCFTAFYIGYARAVHALIATESFDLGGGQSFAIGFPMEVSKAFAVTGALTAISGLTISRFMNKEALASRYHIAALYFLLPAGIVLLIP